MAFRHHRKRELSHGSQLGSRPGAEGSTRGTDGSATRPSRSRGASLERYSKTRRKRKRRGALRIFLIVFAALFLSVGGVALAYMSNISSKLNAGVDSMLKSTLIETQSGDPFYMLLVGVDKNQYRENSSEYGSDDSAYRTDSILLARVDPLEKKLTLVSIHRDTLVELDGYGRQKINAAYSIGAERGNAQSYMVETISKFADVPISHYAEVDFDSFSSIVDAIGGIDVNIPIDLHDDYAMLDVTAGEQTIDGATALALCRARHAYDNYGDGDVYRAANQRMVIGAIMKKVLQSDPVTIANTVNALAGSVTTDLTLDQILSLASSFQGFDMANDMYTGMEPTNSKYVNDTWYEICDKKAWQAMMTRVNKGLPPYEDASEDTTAGLAGGTTANGSDGQASTAGSSGSGSGGGDKPETDYSGNVEVLNGAGVTGLAGRIASTLSDNGFDTTYGKADSYDYSTTHVIYVGDNNKAKAQAVAEVLGLGTIKADNGTYAGEADVVVVLGSDAA